jgi:surface protein
MRFMFNGCESLDKPIFLETLKVTNMSSMFDGCESFNQPIALKTPNVTDMSYMFYGCTKFNAPLDLSSVSSVKNMKGMFQNSAFDQDISEWNIHSSTVTNMFDKCPIRKEYLPKDRFVHAINDTIHRLVRQYLNSDGTVNPQSKLPPINEWDVSEVTDMSNLFERIWLFDEDIATWNTAKVTNMSYMFNGCRKFNQNVSKWITKNVTDMSHMFDGCSKFNQNLSGWDTEKVTDMSFMFYDCSKFNQNLSGWILKK